MTRTVLRNGRVAHRDGEVDLVLEGDHIVSVGPYRPHPTDVEVDVRGRVIVPAFADLHVHLDKAGLYWADDQTNGDEGNGLRGAAERMRELKRGMDLAGIAERAERITYQFAARGVTAIRTHVDVDTVMGLRGVEALLAVRDAVSEIVDLQISVLPTEPGWHHRGAGWDLVRAALELGVDAIGGATGFVDDPEFYVDTVFELAAAAEVDVDLHVDESDDPALLVLEHVARRTLERGYHGRVVAGHCSTLSLASSDDAARVIELVAEAGITIVAMPMTNLYLLGGETGARGMTRVGDLLRGGALVACASDNLQDPFMPYGNGDLLQVAALAGVVGHLGSPLMQERLLAGITEVPRLAMGHSPGRIEVGGGADLLVLEASEPARLLAERPDIHWVVRRGQVHDPRTLMTAFR